MTPACIQTPVSWLDLERYALDELAHAERAQVADHLEACDACRACMADVSSREPAGLPALPAAPESVWWQRAGAWTAVGAAAFAAAAVILLLVLRGGPGGETRAGALPPARVAIKGGELAIELSRESAGSTALSPDRYQSGDRFKVLVTCPPRQGPMSIAVVVFQDGDVFLPLADQTIECGNRVPVAGAFRITGSTPVYVCAALDQPDLEREQLEETAGAALGKNTACVSIQPAE